MSAIDSNSRHLKNAWAWIGLAFAVIVIVLFSTPCIVAHYAVPGRDSEGNDIMVYSTQAYFVASLLWRSRVFAFMDAASPEEALSSIRNTVKILMAFKGKH